MKALVPTAVDLLCIHARELGLEPEREVMFAQPRKWRFDVAFPNQKLAVEVEGGAWANGRHTRGAGFVKDVFKYNAAVIRGWRLLRFTPQMVEDGTAKQTLSEFMEGTP